MNDDQSGDVEGPLFNHSFTVVDDGKKKTRAIAAYWPTRRVVVDVVDRDMLLDLAWSELLRACLQMDAAPQYVVFTNQRDVRLYDLARDRSEPRLTIALDELPKYSEAFSFFETEWSPGATPRIINVDKVSKEVADLVAKAYRALLVKNDRKDDVIRFTLQCIVAMFAEDIGLLPKEYFTTLLYRAGEEGAAEAKINDLFTSMSTPVESRVDGSDNVIPFFNGGLFRDAISLSLDTPVLRALTKAAEANWTYVDPHIFGSVFQGVMNDAERHASGAHYTAREDIMSVVGPTIVEPWRTRIEAAKKLEDLKTILTDLSRFRVLDPACGSGNFLYVAFRELYRLETEVLVRIYDQFPSATQGKGRITWASGIRTTSFFGIDINPFAVELAKTTLNMAKKIAFEQRKAEVAAKFDQVPLEADPSLPLDNLDNNIVCNDALFTKWPDADAIIGNPPFVTGTELRSVVGEDYVQRLRSAHPGVHGKADLCVYWFRLAHLRMPRDGRAGLIGTSSIRHGSSGAASLSHIVGHGGVITDAVAIRHWPGEAAVLVSIVNWAKTKSPEPKRLLVDGRIHLVDEIGPHLGLRASALAASPLSANDKGCSEGIKFDLDEFFPPHDVIAGLQGDRAATALLRLSLTGSELLRGSFSMSAKPVLVVTVLEERLVPLNGPIGEYMRTVVRPAVDAKSQRQSYKGWLARWWAPWRERKGFFAELRTAQRMIACSQVMSRPIFVQISRKWAATHTLQLFGFDDDYSFGIIQSSLHWAWTKAKGGRLKSDIRYTSDVWKTFPWPQEPTVDDVVAVGQAAQRLRATRDQLMAANGWSLRDLYRSAEVEGAHPLKEAQAALDAAVEAAYGKPADQEATEFLLEMNLALAEDEAPGEKIQGPGLPRVDGQALDAKDPRWFSTDCIEPPPLPAAKKAGKAARG